METAIIWTGAACQGLEGPSGYAATIMPAPDADLLRKHGGRKLSTRNRMEIFAAVAGLSALEDPHNVELRSSDPLLVDAVNSRTLESHPDLAVHLMPLLEKHNTIAILHSKRNEPEHQETYGRALRASQAHPQKPDAGFLPALQQDTT